MDELSSRIRTVLDECHLSRPSSAGSDRASDLPPTEWSIERVREDVEIAQEAATESAPLRLLTDDAKAFVASAKIMLRFAREYGIGTPDELAAIRRLGSRANFRLVVTDKPIKRHWLGPCAHNFQGAWEAITSRPSGIHDRGGASPALEFATKCCQLIDASVNHAAVLRAFSAFKKSHEMTAEEYSEFWQSRFAEELRRSAL